MPATPETTETPFHVTQDHVGALLKAYRCLDALPDKPDALLVELNRLGAYMQKVVSGNTVGIKDYQQAAFGNRDAIIDRVNAAMAQQGTGEADSIRADLQRLFPKAAKASVLAAATPANDPLEKLIRAAAEAAEKQIAEQGEFTSAGGIHSRKPSITIDIHPYEITHAHPVNRDEISLDQALTPQNQEAVVRRIASAVQTEIRRRYPEIGQTMQAHGDIKKIEAKFVKKTPLISDDDDEPETVLSITVPTHVASAMHHGAADRLQDKQKEAVDAAISVTTAKTLSTLAANLGSTKPGDLVEAPVTWAGIAENAASVGGTEVLERMMRRSPEPPDAGIKGMLQAEIFGGIREELQPAQPNYLDGRRKPDGFDVAVMPETMQAYKGSASQAVAT